jgi:hypothetical protein
MRDLCHEMVFRHMLFRSGRGAAWAADQRDPVRYTYNVADSETSLISASIKYRKIVEKVCEA